MTATTETRPMTVDQALALTSGQAIMVQPVTRKRAARAWVTDSREFVSSTGRRYALVTFAYTYTDRHLAEEVAYSGSHVAIVSDDPYTTDRVVAR